MAGQLLRWGFWIESTIQNLGVSLCIGFLIRFFYDILINGSSYRRSHPSPAPKLAAD